MIKLRYFDLVSGAKVFKLTKFPLDTFRQHQKFAVSIQDFTQDSHSTLRLDEDKHYDNTLRNKLFLQNFSYTLQSNL